MHPPATLPTRSTPSALTPPTRTAPGLAPPQESGAEITGPSRALQPPARRVAAARARYRTDGNNGKSGGRLLVALYDRLLRDLTGAETAIEANEIENAHLQLVHAQDIVDSLDAALDHDRWDQASRYEQLYAHLRRELISANISKNAAIVARCRRIVEPMATTWQEALDLTGSTPAEAVASGSLAS